MMELEDEREEELSSIRAIFPELITDSSQPHSVILEVPVTPAKPLRISFRASTQSIPHHPLQQAAAVAISHSVRSPVQEAASASAAASRPSAADQDFEVHQLSHLPSLRMQVVLPNGYPQNFPPQITVTSTPAWLPKTVLSQLREKCKELWEESGRYQVVYTLFDYVQQEAENAFGLADRPGHNFEASVDLKLALLDYDFHRRREYFHGQTFDCGVCLEPKKGKVCHSIMLCGHVFCVSCLQDFYNNCITEGDIDGVKCLDPSCAKDRMRKMAPEIRRRADLTLSPSELLQIPIERAHVQRYVHLKRKKRLESNKDTVYCPRKWCQGAAFKTKHTKRGDFLQDDPTSSDESDAETGTSGMSSAKSQEKLEDIPMSERLRICEDCELAFCVVCKKVWHGERAFCNPRRQAELNAEEQASLDYLKKYSTPCPTCNAPAQKSMGCNHMICFKCNTHFCYLCSAYLMPDNPYAHFNKMSSNCYMRLWELEGGDGVRAGDQLAMDEPAAWEVEGDFSDTNSEGGEELALDEAANRDDRASEDDTDDEEPAPDQRRPDRPHIGFVNFARGGVERRVDLPINRDEDAVPAQPAARPRAGRGHGRRINGRRPQQALPRQAHVPEHPQNRGERLPWGHGQQALEHNLPVGPQINAAPGQGNNADEALQRFLRLAMEDREDEWLSDEEEIVVAPRPRADGRGGRRR